MVKLGCDARKSDFMVAEDLSIIYGFYLQTTHLCVLIYIKIKGEVGAIKQV